MGTKVKEYWKTPKSKFIRKGVDLVLHPSQEQDQHEEQEDPSPKLEERALQGWTFS